MIISPPFLSLRDIPVYDDQCVKSVMPGGIVGSGAYPVSQAMAWHGGLHIHAPTSDEPVRAIADGTVIFRRDGFVAGRPGSGNARYDNEDHSTGCVVIRHTTEIGAQGTTPVTVVYYSITQHLRQLDGNLPAVGRAIHRKDLLGLAGTIHGQGDRIHLEIVAGDADMLQLTGRTTGALNMANDGRVSTVFGEIHVLLPAKSAFYSAMPTGTPPARAGDSGADELVVGIRYADAAIVSTRKLDGSEIGRLSEPDAEYNLYAEAAARHRQAPASASPSGWYELLRFARNLGIDPLPADAPHWRKVVLPGKPDGAWVNLNAAGTRKFSDADFPHWCGWRLIDDDVTDEDSRCDSAAIAAMLGSPVADAATPLTPAQKAADRAQNLCRPAVQEKLAKTICKFPTEWARGEVRSRWAWTRKTGNPHMPYPLEDETDFTEMADFAQKLCFWEELPEEDKARLTVKHWHFHPREFIHQFRKCGWLSRNELLQLLPANSLRQDKKVWVWESVPSSGAAGILDIADPAAQSRRVELNKSLRKFCVASSPIRLACFLGNTTQETQWYQKFHENSPYWYKPWDGRGFLQLTHPANYLRFFEFRGIAIPTAEKTALTTQWSIANTNRKGGMTDPTNSLDDSITRVSQTTIGLRNALESGAHERAHSAGAYWAWSDASKAADGYLSNTTNTIKALPTKNGAKHYYENSAFGNVAATVNLGSPSNRFSAIWGIQARFMAFVNAQMILLDNAQFPNTTGATSAMPVDFSYRRP
ncbi:M23 family metallopeptidase [Variovorax sp. RCC_210]|uniref:M23 family metallopeptidase n=1 Tax=Variovorax sp. RCC_210 TaxID=3239217 RepID=UPI00352327E8